MSSRGIGLRDRWLLCYRGRSKINCAYLNQRHGYSLATNQDYDARRIRLLERALQSLACFQFHNIAEQQTRAEGQGAVVPLAETNS